MSDQSIENGNASPSAETLLQPLGTEPRDIVENHFALNPDAPNVDQQPDYTSLGRFREFLIDRFRPDAQPQVRDRWLQVPDGEEITRTTEFNGWWYWGLAKENFGKVLLAANLLVNVAVNKDEIVSFVDDTTEGIQDVKDNVEDFFGIGEVVDRCAVTTTEGTSETVIDIVEVGFDDSNTDQAVGESVVDEQGIDAMIETIVRREAENSVVTNINILSASSDEWRAALLNGLGVPNAGNNILAYGRLLDYVEAIKPRLEALGGLHSELITVDPESGEVVLDETNVMRLENAISANNLTVDEAFDLYKNPATRGQIPESLLDTMKELIGDNRGVRATLTFSTLITIPGTAEVECIDKRTPDGDPENENNDYDPVLIPILIPPIPTWVDRFNRKPKYKWIQTPEEYRSPEYLKLYPEAADENGHLVKDAWAYTRKYQHLMREDDRIQGAYSLSYTDAQGEEQRLRMMFVDHQPTPEALSMFAGELYKIAQMQDGRVGKELDMIAVYPSENAGTKHGNPKRIALGQDIQDPENILGLAYPALGLVEMHMPTDAQELEELIGYDSPQWTFDHEIAGHFTDLNNRRNRLLRVVGQTASGAPVHLLNNRWNASAVDIYGQARLEEAQIGRTNGRLRRAWNVLRDREDPEAQTSKWRAYRGLLNTQGQIELREEEVPTGDRRTSEAYLVRRDSGHPTEYGWTNPLEHYAETAAQKATGESIPFGQAQDGDRVVTAPNFARGYAISRRDDSLLSSRWGAEFDPATDGVRFVDVEGKVVTRPDIEHRYAASLVEDRSLRDRANYARRTPMPSKQDLLHILVDRRISDADRAKKILA